LSSLDIHIIAPFWADADGWGGSYPCGIDDDMVVFYQIYENCVLKNGVVSSLDPDKYVLDSKTQLIISRAQKDALLRDDEFQVSWVAVVTWNKMRPFWHYYNANRVSSMNLTIIFRDCVLV
jgi:hypothetical protein